MKALGLSALRMTVLLTVCVIASVALHQAARFVGVWPMIGAMFVVLVVVDSRTRRANR